MFDVDATIVLRWNPEGSEGKSTKSKIVKRYFGNELIKKLSEITYPQISIQNQVAMRNTESQFLIVRDDGTYELLERFRAFAELNPEIKTFPFGDLDLHLSLYISNHEIDEFVLSQMGY